MKWVKKGSLYATVAVFAVVALLLWLFLDPVLKWSLIRAGQSAAGAKVEIARLSTSLLKGRLEIEGLAVADRSEPMRNLFELGKAAFEVSPSAGLRAKVVIPDAGLTGIRFGTERKTSGKLAFSPPSALEKLIEKQLSPYKKQALDAVGQAKAVPKDVDAAKLSSVKSLDDAKDKLKDVEAKWKDKAGKDKIEARIKEIQAQAKALEGRGNSPADIAQKAQAAAKLRSEIQGLLKEVDESKKAVTQDLAAVQAALKDADDLKLKDLNAILQAAGLPTFDAESLTQRLLGPQAAAKLQTALRWVSLARKHMASQSAKAAKPAKRRGFNVEFPQTGKPIPAFLLEKASLSGEAVGLDLSGTLSGVTSNPPVYGNPARLVLKGGKPGGPSLDLAGLLDQTRAPGLTEATFRYQGVPLAGAVLGDEGMGAAVKAGSGRVSGSLRVVGERWQGTVRLDAEGVSLDPKLSLPGNQAKYAAMALKAVRRFSATIGIEGTEENLKLSLSSDLGRSLADGLKRAASQELEAQTRELRKKIDAAVAEKARPLQERLGKTQGELLGPLNAQQAELQKALQQAVGKAVPGLDKLFRR
jgi:uncharacterized protein (TIGR03545 family)